MEETPTSMSDHRPPQALPDFVFTWPDLDFLAACFLFPVQQFSPSQKP